MGKSVFSLVLGDEIIEQVDKLAYGKGISRSNMVNEILAEFISYETPQKRMGNIFSEVERLLNGSDVLKFLSQPTASMASIRSALTYRYNPTVKYSVELTTSDNKHFGNLKVSLRTQNEELIKQIMIFYGYWTYLENKYVGKVDSRSYDGKFERNFVLPDSEELSSAVLGQAITMYIRNMDEIMNLYFAHIDDLGTY
ncbi:MAG: hypothetical protein RR086_05210, partial [Clostridia bacterium]